MEFIGTITSLSGIYHPFERYIKDTISGPMPLTDLCSGSGKPAIDLFENCGCFTSLLLTDKFPSTVGPDHDKITYDPVSRDVLEMEFNSGRCYTMFNAFHHFTDAQKLKICERSGISGARAFFVEILEPNLFSLLKVLLITTLGTVIVSPFVRPFSLKRLCLTYLIPVNIVTITWDGVISVLRSRSLKKYKEIFKDRDNIKVFRLKSFMNSLIVIQVN
jgi:hypothetical protein